MSAFTEILSKFELDELNKAPLPWFNKSSELRTAASALSNVGGAYPVYLMICGMSLELIYKAIIVVKNSRSDASEDLKIDKHHKLVDLACKASISLDDRNKGMLKILTHYIYWEGRYPTPKHAKDIEDLENLSKEYLFTKIEDDKNFYILNDFLSWDNFDELWNQAKKEFWKIYNT
jgi:hypothetical protein